MIILVGVSSFRIFVIKGNLKIRILTLPSFPPDINMSPFGEYFTACTKFECSFPSHVRLNGGPSKNCTVKSSQPIAIRYGRFGLKATELTAFTGPVKLPSVFPESAKIHLANLQTKENSFKAKLLL